MTEPEEPREMLDEELERELAEALRSAFRPEPLDPRRHSEILERVLLDPFAPASEDELRESERLRRALDTGDPAHPGAALAAALAAAARPAALPESRKRSARAALEGAASGGRSSVVFVAFGTAALAVAAAFALFVGRAPELDGGPGPSAERLVPSRSTAELFDREFEAGKTTERIDRIAGARAQDLRENRYALWGVR